MRIHTFTYVCIHTQTHTHREEIKDGQLKTLLETAHHNLKSRGAAVETQSKGRKVSISREDWDKCEIQDLRLDHYVFLQVCLMCIPYMSAMLALLHVGG